MYVIFRYSTNKTLKNGSVVLLVEINFVTLRCNLIWIVMQGRVKWFDDKRGYGFITGSDGVDIYVHYTAIISDGYRTLKHNWAVSFDVVEVQDGRKEARNVQVRPK